MKRDVKIIIAIYSNRYKNLYEFYIEEKEGFIESIEEAKIYYIENRPHRFLTYIDKNYNYEVFLEKEKNNTEYLTFDISTSTEEIYKKMQRKI